MKTKIKLYLAVFIIFNVFLGLVSCNQGGGGSGNLTNIIIVELDNTFGDTEQDTAWVEDNTDTYMVYAYNGDKVFTGSADSTA